MSIELGNTSYQKRILLDLEKRKKESDPEETPVDTESKPTQVPESKPITASVNDILGLQNVILVAKNHPVSIPNGTYVLPDGRAVVHEDEAGDIGLQYVGDGEITLNDLRNLIQRGLLPVEEGQNAHGINGEIDEPVSQGGTGDCWILTGILSLTATEEGKALIKAAMEVQANGDVIVHFKGLGYSVRVTAAEIKKYDTDNIKTDAFSNGDNDMLVFELAVQKLFEEHPDLKTAYGYTEDYSGADRYITQGGFGNDLVEWLSGKKAQDTSALDVLGDPYEKAGVVEWVTIPNTMSKYAGEEFPRPKSITYDAMFNSSKTDFSNAYKDWYNNTYAPLVREYNQTAPKLLVDGLSPEEIMAQLQEAYENQPCAITFGLYVFANDTVKTARCVDGSTFSFSYYSNSVKDGDLCGHAFAVVGMTRDTITFVNPWDSTQEITMTWSEFAKLGIGRISYNTLDKLDGAGDENPEVDGPDNGEPAVDDSDAESGFKSYSEIIDYLKSDELKNYIKQQLGNSFNESIYKQAIAFQTTKYRAMNTIAQLSDKELDLSSITKSSLQEAVLNAYSTISANNKEEEDASDVELRMFTSYEDLEKFLNSDECGRYLFGKDWLNSTYNVMRLSRLSKYVLLEHKYDYARVSTQDIIAEMRTALKDESNAIVHGTTLDDLKNTYGLRDSEINKYFDCDTRTGQYYLKPSIYSKMGYMEYSGDSGRKHVSTISDLINYVVKEDRKSYSSPYDPSKWRSIELDENGNPLRRGGYKAKELESHIPASIIQSYFKKDADGNYVLKDGFSNFKLLDYNQDTKIATYSIDITKTDGEVVTLEFTVDTTTNELKSTKVITNSSDNENPAVDGPDNEEPTAGDATQGDFNNMTDLRNYVFGPLRNDSEIKKLKFNKGFNYEQIAEIVCGKHLDNFASVTKEQLRDEFIQEYNQKANPTTDSPDVELRMFTSYEDLQAYLNSGSCANQVFGKDWYSAENRSCMSRLSKYVLLEHKYDYAQVSSQDIIEEMRAAIQDESNAIVHGTTLDDLKNTYGLRDSEIQLYFDCDTRTGQYYLKPDIYSMMGYIDFSGDGGRKHVSTISDLIKYVVKEQRDMYAGPHDPSTWGLWKDNGNGRWSLYGYNASKLASNIPASIIQSYFKKDADGNYVLKDGFSNFKLLDYNQDTKIATYSIDITKTDGEVVTLEFTVDTTTNELKSTRTISK